MNSVFVSPLTALRRLLAMHRQTAGNHIVLDVAARQIDRAEVDQKAARALACQAKVEDESGLALLEKVTADGQVTPEEIPALIAAAKHIRTSRDIDKRLASGSASPFFCPSQSGSS